MGRSQARRRAIQGIDSSNFVDTTSNLGPRPTTNTQPAAPTGTLGGTNVLTAAAAPSFNGYAGGTPVVTRQWLVGENRQPIAGATGTTYTQVNANVVGRRIRVRYIAKTKLGEFHVESLPTGVVP